MSKTHDKQTIKADGSLYNLPLSELHVDHSNPRFGGAHLSAKDEKKGFFVPSNGCGRNRSSAIRPSAILRR
jgi:hypothetical protein